MRNFIPEIFIAGSVEFGGQDSFEAAYHYGADALDDEDVKLVTSIDAGKGTVYFIAAHSKDFLEASGSGTSMAHALPGMPEHRGDGVYISAAGGICRCIACAGGGLSAFTVTSAEAGRYAGDHGLQVINTDTFSFIEWKGYRLYSAQKSREIAEKLVGGGCYIAGFACLVWLSAAAAGAFGHKSDLDIRRDITAGLNSAVRVLQANEVHPVESVLEELQKLNDVVGRSKGRVIREFQYDNGKTKWKIKLPQWVNAAEYSGLGNGLKVEADEKDGAITVTKE